MKPDRLLSIAKGLAKAFHDDDLIWHEQEWQQFIFEVRKEFGDELLAELTTRPRAASQSPDPLDNTFADGWEGAYNQLRGIIKKKLKSGRDGFEGSKNDC